MANDYFSFKQFTVWQDRTAMKVGTDGVLLGALAEPSAQPQRILDVGTGTGLVALMLAQRFPQATVHAIDIDPDATLQAQGNFDKSPFGKRLSAFCSDVTTFAAEAQYDFIVSNPPYFNNSLLCPDSRRSVARHSVALTYSGLASAAARLLTPDGTFCVIVPADARQPLAAECAAAGLHCTRVVSVKPTPTKPAKRVVMGFAFGEPVAVAESELLLEVAPRVPSEQFARLTSPFYLDRSK